MPDAQDPYAIREGLIIDEVISDGENSHVAITGRWTSFAELRVIGEPTKYVVESIDQLFGSRKIVFGDDRGNFDEVRNRLSRTNKPRH